MKRPLTLLLAACTTGLAAAAIALPGVAAAYPAPGGPVPGTGTDPYACDGDAVRRSQAQTDPQVQSYLSVHPDLGAELIRLHNLPQSQQSAEWQSYSRSHPQEASDYEDALQPIRDFHQLCDNNHQINRSSDQQVPGY